MTKFFFLVLLLDTRFNATDDDIKRAYRKIVLKHHPDKRKGQGEVISEDDDYFTCITKAYETLGRLILVVAAIVVTKFLCLCFFLVLLRRNYKL